MSTRLSRLFPLLIVSTIVVAGCDSDDDDDSFVDTPINTDMSFFVTSVGPGDGGNLGGLAGADAHCSSLAAEAGAVATEWRAFLSTNGADGENAIDRIGTGPWVNADGVVVANDTDDLLSIANNLNGLTAITENGNTCLLYTSPSPRDRTRSRMPSSA